MFILVLVFLGLAAAAPYNRHQLSGMGDSPSSVGRDLFDPYRFWAEFEAEFRQLNDLLKEFYSRFPAAQSTAGVDGDQYKVTIPLPGFDKKDIDVKSREGVLMVQATEKSDDGVGKNYLDVRTMPDYVNAACAWTYKNDVLTIAFPFNSKSTTPPPTAVTFKEVEPVTDEQSYFCKEFVKTDENEDDAEEDRIKNEFKYDHDVQTNEISKVPVEATTYAML